MTTVPLRSLAKARSGDKGAHANIGVIALEEEHFAKLKEVLTEERVAAYFAGLEPSAVQRYELPKLQALNFVLKGVLQGGGNSSLRIDAQGKALAQALLEMPIEMNEDS